PGQAELELDIPQVARDVVAPLDLVAGEIGAAGVLPSVLLHERLSLAEILVRPRVLPGALAGVGERRRREEEAENERQRARAEARPAVAGLAASGAVGVASPHRHSGAS